MTTIKEGILTANAEHPEWSVAQIAEATGAAISYIYRISSECALNLRKNQPPRRLAKIEPKVLALHNAKPDLTAAQIGDELGLSANHVRSIASSRGLKLVGGKEARVRDARAKAIADARKVVAGFLSKPANPNTVSQIMTALSKLEAKA